MDFNVPCSLNHFVIELAGAWYIVIRGFRPMGFRWGHDESCACCEENSPFEAATPVAFSATVRDMRRKMTVCGRDVGSPRELKEVDDYFKRLSGTTAGSANDEQSLWWILKHTNNWLAALSGRASLIDDCLVARPAKAFSLSSPQAPPKVSWELLPLSGSSLPRPVFLLLTGP